MMEGCSQVCTQVATIAGLEHDVKNLVGWQKEQNGAIHRVEAKLDKLLFWMLTTAVGFISTAVVLYIKVKG